MKSPTIRSGTLASAVSASLLILLDAHPALADPALADPPTRSELVPATTVISASIAEAGGVGQASASWRNTDRPTTLKDARIEADAPDGQVFQSTGRLVLSTTTGGEHPVSVRPGMRVESVCELRHGERSISCALPTIELDSESRLTIAFPTFVAPGAAVTAESSTTSEAVLTAEGGAVRSALRTFVGTRSAITNGVVQPQAGERTVVGQAHPGSRITLTGPEGIAGNTRAGRSGDWSVTLPAGFGTVQAGFTDVSGHTHLASFYYNSYVFSVSSSGTGAALYGHGQPDSTVELLESDGRYLGSSTIPSDGIWHIDLPDLEPAVDHVTVINTLSDGSRIRLRIRMHEPGSVATLNLTHQAQSLPTADGSVHAFVARLIDGSGEPIAGQRIEFVVDGDGELTIASAMSDQHGEASFTVASNDRSSLVITAHAPDSGAEAAITS